MPRTTQSSRIPSASQLLVMLLPEVLVIQVAAETGAQAVAGSQHPAVDGRPSAGAEEIIRLGFGICTGIGRDGEDQVVSGGAHAQAGQGKWGSVVIAASIIYFSELPA